MAVSKTVIVLSNDGSQPFSLETGQTTDDAKYAVAAKVITRIRENSEGGARNSALLVSAGAATATGTLTLSGQPSANDTVTVNGVAFTAKASGAGANEFNIGASKEATAANCAAAVNASVTAGVPGVVTASVSGAVVTFSAYVPGRIGNAITLAKSMANGAVSGAKLTGGADSNSASFTFGAAVS